MTPSAMEALDRLKSGNLRFASNGQIRHPPSRHERRLELLSGQRPFAVILGCSDSRVPAELVFDQGLGDLFVIRVAGNIVASSQIESIEFAAEHFETPLVVVLGHTRCGAVAAALRSLTDQADGLPRHLPLIVERMKPALESMFGESSQDVPFEKMAKAAPRANIRYWADRLRHGSDIIEGLIERNKLLVAGAEYSLETGLVDFFDVPGTRAD